MPVAALPVPPARSPRDPRDDHGRGAAPGRWSDPHERVVLRVVPMNAGRERRPLGDSDVELQRESAPCRSRRPEQPRRVRANGGPNDAGGQMEQARQLREVERARPDVRRSGEDGDGLRRRRRQLARERDRRELVHVALVEPGKPVDVIHHEVTHDAGVVDRWVPHVIGVIGTVGGEPVKRLAGRLHDRALSHRSALGHRLGWRRGAVL
jgi:hypothetical protein